MGIFKKIGDLARSNVTALLDRLEDPKKIADLAILELEASKNKAHNLLVSATAALKMAEGQRARILAEAESLKEEAKAFLRDLDEERAKKALEKRQELKKTAEMYDERLKGEQNAIDTINRAILAINEKISLLKSSSSIKGSLEHLEKADAFDTFSRMEEKIETAENEIEALKELIESSEKKDGAYLTKAPSFDKHSDPEALDSELSALKKKLNE